MSADRFQQSLELARCNQLVFSAKWADEALSNFPILANTFRKVEVAVTARDFLDDVHLADFLKENPHESI
jgi:hypothetical protein